MKPLRLKDFQLDAGDDIAPLRQIGEIAAKVVRDLLERRRPPEDSK